MRTGRARRARGNPAAFMLILCVLAMLVLAYASFYPKQARKMAHPVEYAPLVEAAAQENGLETAHVYAVILCESSFRPAVTSSAGAMGLMQIMPGSGYAAADFVYMQF